MMAVNGKVSGTGAGGQNSDASRANGDAERKVFS